MLSWLTGANSASTSEDVIIPHNDAFLEPPETPAPVFAVRAFKHALFGTPQTVDKQSHMAFDRAKKIKSQVPEKTGALDMDLGNAPKLKAGSAPAPAPAPAPKQADVTISLSPTKQPNGILLTPGTTRRNKTVTFGSQVVDNEGKKQSRSGIPSNCPGKFPSPWTPKNAPTNENAKGQTKLTAAFKEVRDSAQKGSTSKPREAPLAPRAKDDTDLTIDLMEPRSQSGRYWKQEYESYAEKTQREMKKLVIKQKAAKNYAKEKDEQVADLTEQLRKERRNVERLEAKTAELKAQMKQYQSQLRGDDGDAAKLREEKDKLHHEVDRTVTVSPRKRAQSSRPQKAENNDIWADAVFSSPFVHDAAASPRHRTSTSKRQSSSPLKTRHINTLEQQPSSPSRQPQSPSPSHKPKAVSPNQPAPARHDIVDDTLNMSLNLPQPSPGPLPRTRTTPRRTTTTTPDKRDAVAKDLIDDMLDKYTPKQHRHPKPHPQDLPIPSSPPPAFDRLALPMGMGGGGASAKPKPKPDNGHKAADLVGWQHSHHQSPPAAKQGNTGGGAAAADADADAGKAQRRVLSHDKMAAAKARIEARRAAKAQAAVAV